MAATAAMVPSRQSAGGSALAALQRAMDELEATLQSVERAASVVRMDLVPAGHGQPEGSRRATIHPSSSAAAQLAAEVRADLQEWREEQEERQREEEEHQAKQLQVALDVLRDEEEHRRGVRAAMLQHALNEATEVLEQRVQEAARRASGAGPAAASLGEASAGAPALSQLQSQLRDLVGPLEELSAGRPPAMDAALREVAGCVARKRSRARGLRMKMNETLNLDASLFEMAKEMAARRKEMLTEQFEMQQEALEAVQLSRAEHDEAFAELYEFARAGFACAATPDEELERHVALCRGGAGGGGRRPAGAEDDGAPEIRGPEVGWAILQPRALPALGERPEDEAARVVREDFVPFGRSRIRELVDARAHSTPADLQGSGGLEAWKLRTREGLLQDLGQQIEAAHQEVRRKLITGLDPGGIEADQQVSEAAADAEKFEMTLANQLSQHAKTAEAAVEQHCATSLARVSSWRRRSEVSLLKRAADGFSVIPSVAGDATLLVDSLSAYGLPDVESLAPPGLYCSCTLRGRESSRAKTVALRERYPVWSCSLRVQDCTSGDTLDFEVVDEAREKVLGSGSLPITSQHILAGASFEAELHLKGFQGTLAGALRLRTRSLGARTAPGRGSLVRLGRRACGLARQLTQALPLPAGALDSCGAIPSIATTWTRGNPSMEYRLGLFEEAVAKLPDSVETCVVTQGLLCLMEKELQGLFDRLEEPVPFMRLDFMLRKVGRGQARVVFGEFCEMGACCLSWKEGPPTVWRAALDYALRH